MNKFFSFILYVIIPVFGASFLLNYIGLVLTGYSDINGWIKMSLTTPLIVFCVLFADRCIQYHKYKNIDKQKGNE